MSVTRRQLLGMAALGAAALTIPGPGAEVVGFTEALNDGINPDWDGIFKRYAFQREEPGPDLMLCSMEMYQYLNARIEMEYDPNTKWLNYKFAKPTNGPWRRIAGGLHYPDKPITLPA